MAASSRPDSPWTPLRYPIFRALWIATFASNMGTLMQTVGAAWLMTSLASSPLLVALVQTANTLPVFLLGAIAGALADIVDRRKLLLLTQGWMCAIAFVLAVLTLLGSTQPWALLALTFALGVGAALNAPAWQAIVSELVPVKDLPSAVALNSMGLNLARAVAPAIGGLVVASWGPGACFLLNSASFVGVLAVLFRWKREPTRSTRLPAEPLREALSTGIRYVRYTPSVQAVLIRTGAFMIFGTAIWALLPLISRYGLGLGPTGYGVLMGCLGFGAVFAALTIAKVRARVSLNPLLAGATAVYAIATLLPALVHHVWAVCLAMTAAGYAWLVLLSTMNATVQAMTPQWVRGRVLAAYLLVAFGGQALGAAIWGASVARIGLWGTMALCAGGLFLNLTLVKRFSLSRPTLTEGEKPLAPPAEAEAWRDEASRLRVRIIYCCDPTAADRVRGCFRDLRLVRLRNGAVRWEVVQDAAEAGTWHEVFEVRSGMALMRLYERLTPEERALIRELRALHQAPQPPVMQVSLSATEPSAAARPSAGGRGGKA